MIFFRSTVIFIFIPIIGFCQGGATVSTGDLPSFIPPTPEVSAILKSDFLGVSKNTGAANFSIPLHNLALGNFSLPISLNYNSTGVKVDDIASMVGLGWSLNSGGVVSRVVMDIPDETRLTSSNNLTSHNFSNPDYALIDFFDHGLADKQSDIFSFSFGGFSGKFILGQNLIPTPLSKYNVKISIINGTSMEGFIIITDDGTEYFFEDAENSISRTTIGINCKSAEGEFMDEVKTSWYLSKIIMPSRQKEINFTYITKTTSFRSGISESLTLNIAAQNYLCSQGNGPTGPACSLWEMRYSSCSKIQEVITLFVSKIETSDGDKIEFFYDPAERLDLFGGLRLASLKVSNFKGIAIKHVIFNGVYKSALNATSDFESKRLFLVNLYIRDGSNSVGNQQSFTFTYINNEFLPKRLSFAQDIYGFYNGINNNTSLIPKLLPGDINYTLFNNGNGYGSVYFGNRSISATYSSYGILSSIIYPTGGYDLITYTPNYISVLENGVNIEKLCGGVSIQKIQSYTSNVLAAEKEFVYRYYSDNKLSSFLLTPNPSFSERRTTNSDGYLCNEPGSLPVAYCIGPTCTKATSFSNTTMPVSTSGSQHMYYRSVLEYSKSGSNNNGFVEHKYKYYMDGAMVPQTLMGNTIQNAPYNIVPDFLIGEEETNVYKKESTNYIKVKSTFTEYENSSESFLYNYFVRKNYQPSCTNRPGNVTTYEIQAYDVVQGRIYFNTPRIKSQTEKSYEGSGILESVTTMEYNNPAYNYATRIKVNDSKGLETKIDRTYPPDNPLLSAMVSRNIISPVVEEKYYRNNVLQTTKTINYGDWFSNQNLFVPQNLIVKIGSNTQTSKIVYHQYDVYGNVLELFKDQDQSISYLYGYKNSLPTAQVSNASGTQIAYTSFEADSKGNWTFSGVPLTDGSAPTGKKVYNLSAGTVSKTGLVSTKTYLITYWTKNSTPYTIAGTQSGYPILVQNINGWKHYEHKIYGQTSISISGTGFIDELRLFPDQSIMTTMTYEPLIGITSQCDPNNRIIRYDYDEFGRLILVRDNKNDILKRICYNYFGQTENCNIYYNTIQSLSFIKECSPGYTGSSVVYSIPANTYISSVSILEANSKAMNDILNNGQLYANSIGTCTQNVTCNTSNCTGDNKRCVNGVCETGVKVYTDSLEKPNGQFLCTYHYEWSDGYWSDDYLETSSTDCLY